MLHKEMGSLQQQRGQDLRKAPNLFVKRKFIIFLYAIKGVMT